MLAGICLNMREDPVGKGMDEKNDQEWIIVEAGCWVGRFIKIISILLCTLLITFP